MTSTPLRTSVRSMPRKSRAKANPQPAGRKTAYSTAVQKQADAYLQRHWPATGKEPESTTPLPTATGLAQELHVHRDTLYEWGTQYPAFSDTLKQLKDMQEEKLIQNGLAGVYVPVITKLILSTNHGYREKTEQNTKISVGLGSMFDDSPLGGNGQEEPRTV